MRTNEEYKKNIRDAKDVAPASTSLGASYYGDIVLLRKIIIDEIAQDLGGSVSISPEILQLAELRIQNIFKAGIVSEAVFNYFT